MTSRVRRARSCRLLTSSSIIQRIVDTLYPFIHADHNRSQHAGARHVWENVQGPALCATAGTAAVGTCSVDPGGMGKYAQLVIGPAGCGKSTYCDHLHTHCQAIGRTIHIVNLDPAAENFHYPVSLDIRDLISLEDVMQELELGPNGGLLYCMEYLEENLDDWLGEELQGYGDEDYLVFDCPGQIELYNHLTVFRSFVDFLKQDGWSVCVVYCLDAHFITDVPKYLAGAMQALSAMVKLELPHVNILTKMDICEDKKDVEEFLFPEPRVLASRLRASMGPRFAALNAAVGTLLEEFSLVSFVPLDITDEDSIAEVLYNIDTAIQYGEDAEVRVREYQEMGDGEGVGACGMDVMDTIHEDAEGDQ